MSTESQDSSIAARLRDDILRGQYRCGERLPSERDLAERLGVHRSTVRAAFKRLEQLGIADIRQGGARVSPVEEASLEIVEHLLALDDPPDAELVDQTLEVIAGFLSMAARLGVERASPEQLAGMLSLIDEMLAPHANETRRGELVSKLSEAFVVASDNRVLRMTRHALRSRYSNYALPDAHRHSAPHERTDPPLRDLARAIRERNAREAGEAVWNWTSAIRRHIREQLSGPHGPTARASSATDAARRAGKIR